MFIGLVLYLPLLMLDVFFFTTTPIHPVVGIVQMRSLHPCIRKWEIVYIRTHIQDDKIIPEIMGQAG